MRAGCPRIRSLRSSNAAGQIARKFATTKSAIEPCDQAASMSQPGWPNDLINNRAGIFDNDHHRDDPAENEAKESRKNHVRITRDVDEIEVAVNESLRAHDPETYRGEGEHDRVMDRHSEAKRAQVKQNGTRTRDDAET